MKKKSISRRTFWWTVFVALVAVCAMDLAIWGVLKTMETVISPLVTSASGGAEVTRVIKQFHALEQSFTIYGLPASFLFFLVILGAIRLVYRAKNSLIETATTKAEKTSAARKNVPDAAAIKLREQRLFLHLISVLQREGRLIDFFAEDLDAYEDAQIGAAVRGIHGTCRRVVEKNLLLKPVIGQMEGETVSVNPGFDPGTIKLVGNVTGEPPFSGILRHRGWQAGKLELPTFSGGQDPCILAPAEVEIA